jgi:apolipoprotein N-acyltransferase
LVVSWCVATPGAAALNGYLGGLVFFSLGFSWFGETAGALVGPAAPVLVLGPAAVEAPAFAFAAACASFAVRRCDARIVPYVIAAAYTLGELLRSEGTLGVPFSQLGVAMIDSPLRPLAAFVGGYGITFATALLGASLAWWLLDRGDARRARTAIVAWLAVGAFVALAWTCWPARHAAAPTRRVAAVQGGITQSLKMSASGLREGIARYTAMTRALAGAHVSLVLWPETVIPTDLLGQSDLRRSFALLADDLHAPLWVGAWGDDGRRYTNALYLFDPRTNPYDVRATYAKEQLVPFAEWLPGPDWLRRVPYLDQVGAFTPGRNALDVIDGMTPLICWESVFGDLAHARLAQGATLLLIATDDAWFGTTEGPYEHAQAATLRAVESGRWVLRAAATGISGIVAPDGTWTQRTTLGGAATVVGMVGAPSAAPYAVVGPQPIGAVLLLLTVLPFVLPAVLRRRNVA